MSEAHEASRAEFWKERALLAEERLAAIEELLARPLMVRKEDPSTAWMERLLEVRDTLHGRPVRPRD